MKGITKAFARYVLPLPFPGLTLLAVVPAELTLSAMYLQDAASVYVQDWDGKE
jgi:hypothetical protein